MNFSTSSPLLLKEQMTITFRIIWLLVIALLGLNALNVQSHNGDFNTIVEKEDVLISINNQLKTCLDSTSIESVEVCNNGIDDDGDTLIDLFDPDCPCQNEAFQAQCPNICEQIPETFSNIKLKMKWMSKVIGNTTQSTYSNLTATNDGCIITLFSEEFTDTSIYGLYIIDDINKSEYPIVIDSSAFGFYSHIAIGKTNVNDSYKIFTQDYNGNIISLNKTGLIEWTYNPKSVNVGLTNIVKLADINQDGIPELIVGSILLNAQTGNLLLFPNISHGCNSENPFNFCGFGAHPVAADFTESVGLEIAAGNIVYEIEINNLSDSIGNTFNAIYAPEPVRDGFTAFGDFTQDGLPEVVVIRGNSENDGGVWIWDPRSKQLLATGESSRRGGIPSIGDIDGDCSPEIIVSFEEELRVYEYDGTQLLKTKFKLPTSDRSGSTGVTIFDLNSDGISEIIYRDENHLKLFSGFNGEMLDSFTCKSGTQLEAPIVIDIDHDGHAEIIVNGFIEERDSVRIFCFESAIEPWAPARSVWNQTGYHVTNVNDDLTIPRVQQNTAAFFPTDSCARATCPQVYNAFGVQATFRDQRGCEVWPSDTSPQSDSLSHTLCAGDAYNFFDESLTEAGSYVHVVPDRKGCDSIVVHLELAVADTFYQVFQETACDSFTWQGSVYDQSGLYTTHVVGQAGCDSVTTLQLEVLRSTLSTTSMSACDSFTWNGVAYTLSGRYVHYLMNAVGCDSTAYLDLTILPSNAEAVSLSACDSTAVIGVVYTQSGQYTQNLVNQYGCDSVLTLDVAIHPSVSFTEVRTVCDSLRWNGQVLTQSGAYTFDDQTAFGCDSMVTLYLTVHQSVRTTQDVFLCPGDSIFVLGQTLTSDTLVQAVYTSALGCDSIHTVAVYVLSLPLTGRDTLSFCEGDSLVFQNQVFTASGEVASTHTAANGCDSTHITTIRMLPYEGIRDTVHLCPGDSVRIGSVVIYTPGSYTDTLELTDCNVVRTTLVDALADSYGTSYVELCPGDSIYIAGAWVDQPGTYTETYNNAVGCDSIHTYFIDRIEEPSPPQAIVDCATVSIGLSIDAPPAWRIAWDNGDTTAMTVAFGGQTATVELSALTDCRRTFTIDLPLLPNPSDLPDFTDTTLTQVGGLSIDLDMDTSLWDIRWYPDGVADCPTCFAVQLNPDGEEEITAEFTHASGCVYTLSFLVRTGPVGQLVLANIFSPNGDGNNEFFEIDLTDKVAPRVFIYDRWGDLVFRSENQTVARWDGRVNGRLVNPGVFVVVVEYTEGSRTVRIESDVTVVR